MGIELVSRPATRLAKALPGASKTSIAASVIAAMAAGASPAFADIELGEGLSVSGFVDMSIIAVDPDGGSSFESAGIDQVETDFKYTGSNGVTAQVDIEYGESSAGDPDDDTTFVEQAFISKAFNEQFSMKFGRFLSYSGWETEEPTGLFQYSGVGYAPAFYGYYQQGVSAYYDGGMFDLMGSVVTSVFNPLDREVDDLSFELGVAFTPMEGLTAKAFFLSEKDSTFHDETTIVNAWLSYAMSGWTFAAEYNTADYADGGDGDGFLVMANYARGPWGITGRYHDWDVDTALAPSGEVSGFTISPSYKVGSNLLLVAEYRMDDYEGGGDVNTIALEALFTF